MTRSDSPPRFASIAIACLLAACAREQPAPANEPDVAESAAPAPAEPPAPEPARIPGTDAIAAVDNVSAEAGVQPASGIDAKAFAGVFTAEGARIEFKPDGTYAMTVHAASADADLDSSGTWTADAGGTRLVLDSDDKSEADLRYQLVSHDELKGLDDSRVLRREGAH